MVTAFVLTFFIASTIAGIVIGRQLQRSHSAVFAMLRASQLRTELLLTERLFLGDRGVRVPELPPWFWDDAVVLARHELGSEERH